MNECHKEQGCEGIKEKKKVSGWSAEEMKEKLSVAGKEDAEVKKWSPKEKDQS